MSVPSKPSAWAWAIAASSAGLERGYSERVSTNPCAAPTAKPASASPSSSQVGFCSIRYLSM